MSLSLFKAWNGISDKDKEYQQKEHSSQAPAVPKLPRHNHLELKHILVCVGLQERIAGKVADEVFEKLSRACDEKITFDDFVSLIQSDVTTTEHFVPAERRCDSNDDGNDTDNDADNNGNVPVTTISRMNLHAPHSGWFKSIMFL